MDIPKGFKPETVSDVKTEHLEPIEERKVYGLKDLILTEDESYVKNRAPYTIETMFLEPMDIEENIYVEYRNMGVIILKFVSKALRRAHLINLVTSAENMRDNSPALLLKGKYAILIDYFFDSVANTRLLNIYKKEFGFEEVKID